MAGKLVGIGLGPGNGDMLTGVGKTTLNSADRIITPVAKKEADSRVEKCCPPEISNNNKFSKMVFPMSKSKKIMAEAWQNNAAEIENYLKKDEDVAFLTLGEPSLYSTFYYLKPYLKADYEIEVIPGISCWQYLSSKLKIPLTAGEESLAILPKWPAEEKVDFLLNNFTSIVVFKAGPDFNFWQQKLRQEKLLANSYLACNLGFPEEKIYSDLEQLNLKALELPYLTLLLIVNKRRKRGYQR